MNVCALLWKRHCELASVKLRGSHVVHPPFSSSQVTVYSIQPRRGFEQAATAGHAPNLIGPSSAALPERRSWWPEREPASFPAACKKFCSEHSNYATVAIEAKSASGGGPRTTGSAAGSGVGTFALLAPAPTVRQSSVTSERPLFTFLNCPGPGATNWRAEEAIRPTVARARYG